MLEDGNPVECFEAKGEALWSRKRGPKIASLEQCNLGLGPGVVKGAWVQLPRYFSDTARVQDLESRLLTCMATLRGLDVALRSPARLLAGASMPTTKRRPPGCPRKARG